MIVTVVLPAYNCAKTLEKTLKNIPRASVHHIVLVDDASTDETISTAKALGLKNVYKHSKNLGYGANQKTCYDKALELGSDVIVMLHPDNQYDPSLIVDLVEKVKSGAQVVLASRMKKGREALEKGMPKYKYFANKVLTKFQNRMFNMSLSEYHTGYRAYTRDALIASSYQKFSNNFIFDNQILLKCIKNKCKIDEIYCPARYEADSSSIGFFKSVVYGMGVLYFSIQAKICH